MSVTFFAAKPECAYEKNINPDNLLWSISVIFRPMDNYQLEESGLSKHNLKDIADLSNNAKLNLKDDFRWSEILDLVEKYKFKYKLEDQKFRKLWTAYKNAGSDTGWGPILVAYGEFPEYTDKEIQLSNYNAHAITELLGLEEEGCINPVKLLKIIEQKPPSILISREPEYTHEPGKAHMYTGGLSISRISEILGEFERIASFCIQQEVDFCWG